MAGKMGVGTGETEQTILSRLDSDIQEQRVRVGYLSTYNWDKKKKTYILWQIDFRNWWIMGAFVGQVKDFVYDKFGLKYGVVNVSGRNSVSIHSLECIIHGYIIDGHIISKVRCNFFAGVLYSTLDIGPWNLQFVCGFCKVNRCQRSVEKHCKSLKLDKI